MSDSIYREQGMHLNVPPDVIKPLLKKYRQGKNHKQRQGFFLGTDFLTTLAKSLKKGGYDGLIIRFGMSEPTSDLPAVLELIGTAVELEGGDSLKVKPGKAPMHYCTVGQEQTNPPSLPCPPMGNPDGN